MGIIRAICISEQKGTQKHEISEAEIIEDAKNVLNAAKAAE